MSTPACCQCKTLSIPCAATATAEDLLCDACRRAGPHCAAIREEGEERSAHFQLTVTAGTRP